MGADTAAVDVGLRAYMLRVYNYMLMGLAISGLTAWVVATVPQVQALFFQFNPAAGRLGLAPLGWVALLAPLGLVFFLGYRIQQMSLQAAQTTFWVFAALMGVSIAPVLLVYTGVSVAQVFFVTAASFGGLSLYGYTTQRDLSPFGSFLIMGLWGLIIATLVNFFLQSSMLMWITSVIGVGIFAGLTAYDTQRIKEMYYVGDDGTVAGKKAVMGALSLYLDFVNMFMFLMRLLGDRR
jgi:FtsH-binding integral membrane protein